MNVEFIRETAPKISVLLLILLSFSCTESSSPESDWENIGIHQLVADSIEVVDSITTQDTLTVVLSGYTNPDGRLTLSSIETDRTPTGISLTIWVEVERWIGSGVMPPFDTSIRCAYDVLPPFNAGTFSVIVEQPDASQLVTSVEVIE